MAGAGQNSKFSIAPHHIHTTPTPHHNKVPSSKNSLNYVEIKSLSSHQKISSPQSEDNDVTWFKETILCLKVN